MNGAMMAYGIGLLVLGLGAALAFSLAAARRTLDLTAVLALLLALQVLSLMLFGAPEAAQAFAAAAILMLFLLLAANQGAQEPLPERTPWMLMAASVLSAAALAALLLQTGPPAPEPLGAYLSRRALSEFGAGVSGVHAAMLSFRLTWSLPAAAGLVVAGGGVWALLRHEPVRASQGSRP